MKSSIKDRIISKIRKSQEEAIEQKAAQGYEAYEIQERNNLSGAILAQAVFEFESTIEKAKLAKLKGRQKRIARRIGHNAMHHNGSLENQLTYNTIRQQLLFRSIKNRDFAIYEKFIDRPDLFHESAEGIQLPVDEVEYQDEFAFNKQWSVEIPHISRPAGSTYCHIYRKITESHSGESGKEMVYRIHANRHPYNSDSPIYEGGVISYTDGIEDDPFITVGKNAVEHATALVRQAIEQVNSLPK